MTYPNKKQQMLLSCNVVRLISALAQVCPVVVVLFFLVFFSLKLVCIDNVSKSVEPSNRSMLVEHL